MRPAVELMKDSDSPQPWSDRLAELDKQGLRRRMRAIDSAQGAWVERDGRRLCNFASNDYLGLANDPRVRQAAIDAIEKWGFGAGASRLVTGTLGIHEELEARLAAFKQTEAALVCSTGYQANLAVLRALTGPGDLVLLDKLDHASIIDGAFAAAGAPGGGPTVRTFGHRDYEKLQRLLNSHTGPGRRIIVTDSVFSMDGDFADLPRLVELKQAHDALLVVDEAHATGVFGANGRGLAEHLGVEEEIDVTVGTLSKALGGLGGFIAASREIIEWVTNTARSFIYTTAPLPAACGAALAALDIVKTEPERRTRVLELADRLRRRLRHAEAADGASPSSSDNSPAALCVDLAGSTSQIVPLVVETPERAIALSEALLEAGFLAPAIRPPTVPRGQSRVRISLTAGHTEGDVDALAEAVLAGLVGERG